MNFFKRNKGQIILGVVIAILVLWCEPLLIQLRDLIIMLAIKMSSSFSDYYYSLLSSRNGNLSSDYLLYIVGTSLMFLLGLVIAEIQSYRNKMLDSYDKLMDIRKPNENSEDNKLQNSNKKKLKAEIEDLLSQLPSRTNVKRTSTLVITFAILFFGYFVTRSVIYTTASSEISKFEHQLKIIKYNTDIVKLTEIEYHWATMENKEDYIKIKEMITSSISKVKQKNGHK